MKCHHAPVQNVVILVHGKEIVAQVSNAANDPLVSKFKYQVFFKDLYSMQNHMT